MSRKRRDNKKRTYINVNIHIDVSPENKVDKKVSISQKLTFLSATITLIIAIINFITKIIG